MTIFFSHPPGDLSQAMPWQGVTYANRCNPRRDRSCHLFLGRFKSILVQNDAHLLQLSYNVHCNPLQAGLVKRLFEYRLDPRPRLTHLIAGVMMTVT